MYRAGQFNIKFMGKILSNEDYCKTARRLNCGVANIKAVALVESAGSGFLPSGLNMFPKNALDNIFYRSSVDVESFCKSQPFFAVFSESSQFNNIFFGQLCSAVFLALIDKQGEMVVFAFVGMTFFIAVTIIVQMGSQKQMIWVYAFSNIASVTNKELVRVGFVVNKISNSVSQSVSFNFIILVGKLPIARRMEETALPFPTLVRKTNINFLPKSFDLLLRDWGKNTIKNSHRFFISNIKSLWLGLPESCNLSCEPFSILTQLPNKPYVSEVFA